MNELPNVVEIKKIINEAEDVKTFFFDYKVDFKTGQFFMLWIPGFDEKPFAVSYYENKVLGITIHKIGPFTTKIFSMKKKDKIGIRGPYGNGFKIKNKACVVGGGVGMAELSMLIEKLKNPVIVNGARSKKNLVFLKRFSGKKVYITTDDGSFGEKGFTTDILRKVLEKEKFGIIYTCGPEIMMKKIFEMCEKYKIECQASLERYMSCGFGICGKCMIDDKILCTDGPVLSSRDLRNLTEFGHFARLRSGKKVLLAEYYEGKNVIVN